ncbi:DUF2961 domain-containing protein [Eubacteriales bacterium OttesenSCG-928-N13]|nr:DUF2961 domain-containing protein [Eubacteriales bacterium OttesenSCG-928-N13]
MLNGFTGAMNALPMLKSGRSRSINWENRNGEKGAAAMAPSALGPSRKGSPCIRSVAAGETVVLANIDGPGTIQHIWLTVADATAAGKFVLRDVVLRMFWDGEETPSVECPLGDFFLNGFARGCEVNSMPIVVNPKRGMNSYLQMPFRKHARIEIENQHKGDVPGFFFQIDYCLHDELPEDIGYFHAQWRRERLTQLQKDYVLLDNVKGKGHYIGTYLALTTLERYWWGEGEFKFYIDGDDLYPTQCSTGTEDYFGGAWSFGGYTNEEGHMVEKTYCTPFLGYPFYSHTDTFHSDYWDRQCPPMRGFYRWHILDPILFEQDLRVELQQIGVCDRGLFERQDDVASVSYWYQSEPHNPFPALPGREERWPR